MDHLPSIRHRLWRNALSGFVIATAVATAIALLMPAAAQTLTLRDGTVVSGVYKGGTAEAILFEVGGEMEAYALADVLSLVFEAASSTGTPPPPPPEEASSGKTDALNPSSRTLAAGTRLVTKTTSVLITGRVAPGQRFEATLQGALTQGSETLVDAGATVLGRVVEAAEARRVAGRARLVLELTDVTIAGRLVPITTNRLELEGDRSGTLKKTAGGAIIGGIVEGDDGAATGAVIGGGISFITPGNQIKLPVGTLIEFRTTQPFAVPGS